MAPLRLRFRFFSNFQKLYFTNPWVNSLVYEGKSGRIVGFLGVIVRKMSVFGQPIRVAFGGSCVVDPEARSNLAGMRVLGTRPGGRPGSYADGFSQQRIPEFAGTTRLPHDRAPTNTIYVRPVEFAPVVEAFARRLLAHAMKSST
jgi:hypothetical protein